MKIINHFYKQLKTKSPEVFKHLQKAKESQPNTYIVAHFNTNNSSLFWLSNHTFHAKFKDNTQMVIDQDNSSYLTQDKREILMKGDQINNQDIRSKYTHIMNLIKKIKRNKYAPEEKKEGDKRQSKEKPT